MTKNVLYDYLLTEEQQKNKELQRELTRKEKALAETAALLVLRKKTQAYNHEHLHSGINFISP